MEGKEGGGQGREEGGGSEEDEKGSRREKTREKLNCRKGEEEERVEEGVESRDETAAVS